MKKLDLIKKKIEDVKNITVVYFRTLFKLFFNKKVYDEFDSLGSIDIVKNNEVYEKKLKNSIDNKNTSNIALSGIYGSGKSSILKSFFKKIEYSEYNPIFISLGSYDQETIKKYCSDETLEESRNAFKQGIEKSIVQQIIYQVDGNKLPLSRFNRINNFSKIKLIMFSIITLIIIFCVTLILNPKIIVIIKNNFNILNNYIEKKYIIIFMILSIAGILFITYKLIFYLKYKIKINKFKVSEAEIDINEKNESVFNKYLDEILYFFQVTKYNVVVIEDLDRFDKIATSIFQKLRELNQVLNSSEMIDRKITFIYAIRDEFFSSKEDRTKFFEDIIPVVPIASYTSSNSIINNGIKIYNKKYNTKVNLSNKYINDISTFLSDMRLIKNILNEFYVIREKLTNKELDDEHLFSIILYKNIDPEGYTNLIKRKGIIYSAFSKKKENIEKIIKLNENEINNLVLIIKQAEKEYLQSIYELKSVLISCVYDYSHNYSQYFYYKNSHVSIPTLLNNNFDIKDFLSHNITYYNNGRALNESEIFSKLINKNTFLERINIIDEEKNKFIEKKSDLITSIKNNNKIITEKKLHELIKEYGENNFVDYNGIENDIKDLISFLLRRGYINENYEMYLFNFEEGDLTYKEIKFITSIKRNIKLEYDYNIDNINKVIERLDDRDFELNCIFNYDLLKYLISNPQKYKTKINRIFNNLKDLDSEKLDFIEGYLLNNNENTFFDLLFSNNKFIWSNLYQILKNDIKRLNKWIFYILKFCKNIIDLDNYKELINYLEKIENFDDIFKGITKEEEKIFLNTLLNINIKFTNISLDKEEISDFIYENNMYVPNDIMIIRMMEYKRIDISEVNKKGYSIIHNTEDLKKMCDYIEKNINLFLDKFYFKNNNMDNDSNLILNLLKRNDITNLDKEKIIEKENKAIVNLCDLELEICNYALDSNKVITSIDNINYYYEINNKNLNEKLINFINNNMIQMDDKKSLNNELIICLLYCSKLIEPVIDILLTVNLNDNDIDVKKLSEISLNKMIEKNLIKFNKDNFDFIIEKNQTLYSTYICNNSKFLLTQSNEVINDETKLSKVINISELDEDVKLSVIKSVDDSLITINSVNPIADILINKKEILTNSKYNKILSLLDSENKKVKLINCKISKQDYISDSDIQNIKNLSSDFSLENYSSIDNNLDNNMLLKKLKEEKIIKNYSPKKKKIIIYS